jgi:hypothetical protein
LLLHAKQAENNDLEVLKVKDRLQISIVSEHPILRFCDQKALAAIVRQELLRSAVAIGKVETCGL